MSIKEPLSGGALEKARARRLANDRREPIEHDRSTPENFDAFRFDPGTYDAPGKPERLRVLGGEKTFCCCDILYERTTSEARSAETLNGGGIEQLPLTTMQAEWLYRTLGRFLEWRSRYDDAVDVVTGSKNDV